MRTVGPTLPPVSGLDLALAWNVIPGNGLLASLASDDQRPLGQQLERVVLAKGRILLDVDERLEHAYFPTSGLISLMAVTDMDQSLELAVVGKDGFIGVPLVLHDAISPYQVMVQVEATAWRVQATVLRDELRRHGGLQQLLLRYGHDLQREIAQGVICHRFHSTSQRLSRWLVAAQDKLQSDVIQLTHESLAHILGVPRTAVTAGALVLQDAGYIRYRHGRISIVNRERLARTACACYRTRRREENRFHLAH